MKSYYEKRYISKSKVSDLEYLSRKYQDKTLIDILFEEDKVILLGNPGIGKTTELKMTFDILWERKKSTGFAPIEIDLKYFRKASNFENLILYKQWRNLPGIIFILDGLDEVSDIHDFLSEFEIFIANHKHLNVKYLVSCRTNIYEKYLISLKGFETYFLKNLNVEQVESILKNKYEIPSNQLNLTRKQFEYLYSPFFLDLFAKYFINKNKWPESESEIWDLYINKTIEEHKKRSVKKKLLSAPVLIKSFKKVAVVNELMQRSFIDESELYEILGDNYSDFLENPFLNYNATQDKWSFEHKQIQEYFVAKSLIEQDYNNLLKIIKVDGANAIHPSIFNSLSFYLNISDPNNANYQRLVDWLQQHQFDILLKSEPDRIKNHLKEDVFQNYFKQECIEKTHWISTNRTFEVNEIANFADTPNNYKFLINIIRDPKSHIRTTISAINVLAHFSIDWKQKDELKALMLEMITSSEVKVPIKAECIQLIDIQKFTIEDIVYLNDILKYFKNETNKQINVRLLFLISKHHKIDDFFPLIKAEFLRELGIERRNDDDNVIRGNSYIVQQLILRLENKIDFLESIKYIFDDTARFRFDNDFAESIKRKLIEFDRSDKGVIIEFMKIIGGRITFRSYSTFIKNLLKESDSERMAVKFLLENYSFNEIDYFLSEIVNPETIDLVENYLENDKNISDEEVERFRNFVSNLNDRSLAISFNDNMSKKGRKFKQKALSAKELNQHFKKIEDKTQKGYDLLFDKPLLLDELKKIFESNDDSIDFKKYQEIDIKWYEDNGHGSIISPVLSLLGDFIYSERGHTFTFDDIAKQLEDDFVLIKSIKTTLERNKHSSWKFKTNEKELNKITEWCKTAAKEIDFEEIIFLHAPNRFSYGINYEKLETILYFWKEFQIDLPQKFILNCLKFAELGGSINWENNLSEFKLRISNDNAFDKQIIDNIKENRLFSLVLYSHINYAIENELVEVYPEILKSFKNDISIVNEQDKVEQVIQSIARRDGNQKAIDYLKWFCEDINSRICWVGIKILNKYTGTNDFCEEIALTYLNSKETKFISEALEVLFINNHLDAIDYFIQIMENNSISNIRFINFGNYSNIKSYDILNKLYAICYGNDSDGFDSHLLRSFFNSYIANLSRNDEGYTNIQDELRKIKQQLNSKDEDLFYINMLLEDSTNSYINFKSKAYTLVEALEKIKELSI